MTEAVQQDLRDAVRGLLASADDEAWGRLCREGGVAAIAACLINRDDLGLRERFVHRRSTLQL